MPLRGIMRLNENISILLVEDNPAHAEIVLRSFETYDMNENIFHVSDGQEALDYLYREGNFAGGNAKRIPDLIILDLRLPKVDGIEVLKKIKSDIKFKTIPVIILTTSESDKDIAKAYTNHVNSYLVKPIDLEKFGELIESFGYYWFSWNKFPVN